MEVDFKLKSSVFERVSRIVNSELSQDEMLGQILGLTAQVSNCDACLVYLMEFATGEFVLRASQLPHSRELSMTRMKFGEGITGSVAENQRPVALRSRAQEHPRFKSVPGLIEDRYEALLSVPLVHKGRSIGVINVHHRDAHEHTAEEIASVAFIGEQMGAAIAKGLLEEENARLAERDRRLEQQRLRLEAEVARRTEELEASNVQLQAAKDRAEAATRLEKVAAEAEAANRAKSIFLSTMSHEIRTPMNAILGYAQLMLRDPDLGTKPKENLRIIIRSGEHLLSIINDILDMSKIEAGRTEVNTTTFSLVGLLNDLAAMFRLRARAKALQFDLTMDGEEVPYIVADEGKIRQVLINLLGNAMKFTEHGGVKLHVALEQRVPEQLWLSARVEDSGRGIESEDRQKLFEPFSQIRGGPAGLQGTGLGLAITRKYARLMGGDVTVTSQPGNGSVFRFEIPTRRGDPAVAVRRSVPRRVIALRAGQQAPKILVVDDRPENRDWLIKLLTVIGFSVRGAENGEAAVRNWEQWKPALILMDVHMPVMDGLQAAERIKTAPGGRKPLSSP